MKLLIPVLVVLVAVCDQGCLAQTSTDAPPEDTTTIASNPSAAPDSSTTSSETGSTAANPSSQAPTGSTGVPATGATGGNSDSTDGTTTQAPSTTTTPLQLSTFPIANDLSPQDAKLILQHALQLDQQIQDLNSYLINAQKDTDADNSPLFGQLNDFSANITAQNATLQGYIQQLQSLSSAQASLDQRIASATGTFTCFSTSSCVTDIPTTPEPTSPGPTPSVTPCTNPSPLTATSSSQTYSFAQSQNAAQCSVSVVGSVSTNNVSVLIDVVITGNNASVQLVETRTKRSVVLNTTTTGYNFTGFQQVDVFYFSDPRSTVQFNFTYVEVNTCLLDCNSGTCKVSQSGVQYCECPKCQYTGDFCETPLGSPCQSKQQRVCGEKYTNKAGKSQPYGKCYLNICADQCYACECSKDLVDPDNAQTCLKPTDDNFPVPDAATTGPTVCPTTAAPTTTAALLTSTVAAAASSTPSGTDTTGESQTTVTGGSDATTNFPITQPSDSSATVDSSATTAAAGDTTTVTAEPSGDATTTSTGGGGDN